MGARPDDAALLIVGLGNPGPEYESTRHNAGAEAVLHLAVLLKLKLARSRTHPAWIARRGGLVLARPDTFMNESGPVVRGLVRTFKARFPLVVSDDLDLPLGTLRFRTKGSAGGHRGLASIIAALGTSDFPRLRIGIGRPAGESRNAVVDHVLSPVTPDEREAWDLMIARAARALHTAATRGLGAAMTEHSS